MRRNLFTLISIAAFAFVLAFAGCSGGGGGGGGGGDAGISYTGKTSQAVIDEGNAVDFSTAAYLGGDMGSALGGVAAVQIEEHKLIDRPRTMKLTRALETAIGEVDVTAPAGVSVMGTIKQESNTIQGDCPSTPGSAAYTIAVDDVTGNFSGNFEFSSYCSEDVTISGRAIFSGKIDPDTLDFRRFRITFDSLTATSGYDSITTRGYITYDFETFPVTATMDLLLEDNSTETVYWVKYSMTIEEGPNYVEIDISGTYYDPVDGYVVVSTEVPLLIYDGEDWPSEGVLVVIGDTGLAGGSTQARLTALSSNTYQVEADTQGDDLYDWNSGILFWDE